VWNDDNCRSAERTYLLPLYQETQGNQVFSTLHPRGRFGPAVIKTNPKKVSLRQDWAERMLKRLKQEEKEIAQSCFAFIQEKKEEIKRINQKLQRLLDAYLEQPIDRETYLEKKAKLISQKKTLEEQIIRFEKAK